jgi:hypothetical protein
MQINSCRMTSSNFAKEMDCFLSMPGIVIINLNGGKHEPKETDFNHRCFVIRLHVFSRP